MYSATINKPEPDPYTSHQLICNDSGDSDYPYTCECTCGWVELSTIASLGGEYELKAYKSESGAITAFTIKHLKKITMYLYS
jgi:hypothetical protein